ncbi:nucleotide exchange factor GrpE [Sphaerisporangium sp. TRM90804]|uniref:nucleotide exchange factor GrpE n=1 Tax=Sphaerisporangium sp. TRM90804 TaxID=3031113 RepID=UPI00244C9047|nr:nucleotide exchange factor GrpE [Sphaerisporangium sp. TRM90804]MDH2424623.1 nucleotide exchange factor GrpE [Sphaerisporangium sp. TRM90804]
MAPPPQEPHEPAAGGPPDTVKELARQIEELTRQVAALTETARREHERAAHREQVIDRLHTENQQLRHGLLQEALTPVRAGLYRLHDTVAREAARWRGPEPPPAELAAPLLEAVAEDVAEVLGRTGAERAGTEAGAAYDPALHRPARVAAVGPEADGTVVEVLADGFAMGERVLRKATVVVGRSGPSEAPAPTPGSAGGENAKARDNERKDPKNGKKAGSRKDVGRASDRKHDNNKPPYNRSEDATMDHTDGGTEKGTE